MRIAVVLAVVAAAAACKGHPAGEATCDQVGARFYQLAHAQVAISKEVDDRERAGVIGLLAPMRDSMVRACRDDGWSAPARACFATAAEQTSYFGCETSLSPEQRALLAKSAARK